MNPLEPRKKITEAVAAKAVGNGLFRFVLSSPRVDRDKDSITQSGWNLDEFRKNPKVLWAHRHDVPAIATCPFVGVVDGQLVGDAQPPPRGIYPFADTIWDLVTAGVLTDTSVGFLPVRTTPNDRGGFTIHEATLLEWSVVNVPSNQDARLITPTTQGAKMEAVAKWLGTTGIPVDAHGRIVLAAPAPDPDPVPRRDDLSTWTTEVLLATRATLERMLRGDKSRIGCPIGSACPMGTVGGGDALCPAGAACAYPGAPAPGRHTTNPVPRPAPTPAPTPVPSLATDVVARPAGQTDCPKMGNCGFSAGNPCAQNDNCPLGLGPTHPHDPEMRTFEAVLTSTTVNSHGDRTLDWIFPAAGAPIFVDHGETTRPVGRAYPGRRDSQRQYGRLVFPPAGAYPASDRAVADIECGLLTCLSTAFRRDKTVRPAQKNRYGGHDFQRVIVQEVSLVARGANPDTIVYVESPDSLLARATPAELGEAVVTIIKELRTELHTEVVGAARLAFMQISGRLD